jgi:uncharacterized membrane protein
MTPDPLRSSTGLSSPVAAALAYSGWWITGGIFWWLERHDRYVRFHAAQSVIVLGAIAVVIALCVAFAVLSLSFMPSMFAIFVSVAALMWLAGVVLSGVSMWKAASGDGWRIPVAADWADRLSRPTASAAAWP